VSPALAFIGISLLGTWGLASIGLIAGGIILLVDPGDAQVSSGNVTGGVVLIAAGLVSGAIMQVIVMPLLGLDPPIPISAKKIIPTAKLTRWVSAGNLREFPDGVAKEVRLMSRRIAIIRQGETAQAVSGLCPHARLPFGGFPGSPLAPEPISDGCVTCPFHGARFDLENGKVVRQPFTSEWNNDHPFLGRVQGKMFGILSKVPAPPGMGLSTAAEDVQTFPVKVEDGEVFVAIPERK
jgi:nitrite reductase/ring-hydroxylating ferredoxin subunit